MTDFKSKILAKVLAKGQEAAAPKQKPLWIDLSFIILNPESNPSALRMTKRTIDDFFQDVPHLCVVPKGAPEKIDNLKYSKIIEGKNTLVSLIDEGIKACKSEWCFIIMAGTHLKPTCLKKFERFLNNDKEILYPVVDRKWSFDEASINGILISKKTYLDVGEFGDGNYNLEFIKLLWANKAIDKGYKFKPLVGARLV